jgi:hypothetical protein
MKEQKILDAAEKTILSSVVSKKILKMYNRMSVDEI